MSLILQTWHNYRVAVGFILRNRLRAIFEQCPIKDVICQPKLENESKAHLSCYIDKDKPIVKNSKLQCGFPELVTSTVTVAVKVVLLLPTKRSNHMHMCTKGVWYFSHIITEDHWLPSTYLLLADEISKSTIVV